MGLRFIRKPSDIPNVLNVDDIRMARYAYGNQSGYIKGYGQELSHTIVSSTFMINSGIFVIQGAEIEIDANGWGESVSGVTNKRYYIIYGEVNLSLQIAEIKSKYHTANYPTIEAGDDLTQSTDGTARVELYRFTATNGLISDVVKVVKAVEYFNEEIDYRLKNKASFYAGTDNQLDSNYPTGTTLFCNLKYDYSNTHFESDFYYNAKAYLFLKTNGYEVIAINDFYAKTLAYKEYLKIDKNYRRLGGTWRSRGTTTINTESPRGLFQRVADETEEMPPEYGE